VRSLGTKLNNPPRTHLVHEAPKLTPPEPYEFREMTLGCRFGMLLNIHYRPYDAHKTHAFTLSSPHGPAAHHQCRYNMDRLTSKVSYAHKVFWCPQRPAQGLQPYRRTLHGIDVVQPPCGGTLRRSTKSGPYPLQTSPRLSSHSTSPLISTR